MTRVATVISIAIALLISACSSGPALTDAQTLWCIANDGLVHEAQEALDLKNEFRVWGENRGVKYNDRGFPIASDNLDEVREEWDALSDAFELYDTLYSEWLEHPDGIRSCIAAFDLR